MGIGERTIRDRLNNPKMAEQYSKIRADVLQGAVHRLTSRIGDAADVLTEIMDDDSVNPAVRVSAARSVLEYAGKLSVREVESHSDNGQLAQMIDDLKFPMDPLSASLYAEAQRLMEEYPPEN